MEPCLSYSVERPVLPAPTGLFAGVSFPLISIRPEQDKEEGWCSLRLSFSEVTLIIVTSADSVAMRHDPFANDVLLPATKINACMMPPRLIRLSSSPHPNPADSWPDNRLYPAVLPTRFRLLRPTPVKIHRMLASSPPMCSRHRCNPITPWTRARVDLRSHLYET